MYIAFIYKLWYNKDEGGGSMGSKYTDAQKRATQKYLADKTDNIQLRAPKGTRDRWRAAAEAEGVSLTRFIMDAVEAAVDATNTKQNPPG